MEPPRLFPFLTLAPSTSLFALLALLLDRNVPFLACPRAHPSASFLPLWSRMPVPSAAACLHPCAYPCALGAHVGVVQTAHVMAMAVQKLFPSAQVTIGPWIAKGFYYDFDLKEPLTDKDLKKIKKEMVGATVQVLYYPCF